MRSKHVSEAKTSYTGSELMTPLFEKFHKDIERFFFILQNECLRCDVKRKEKQTLTCLRKTHLERRRVSSSAFGTSFEEAHEIK